MKRYVLELLKEQWEIVRLAEHTKNKTDVGCLVFADVLTLTCIFFVSLQELYYYSLYRGPSTQQPEPSPLPTADVQPGSQ